VRPVREKTQGRGWEGRYGVSKRYTQKRRDIFIQRKQTGAQMLAKVFGKSNKNGNFKKLK
jgi:hypothetical protein